jgi:SAM-dependent methyltransferase
MLRSGAREFPAVRVRGDSRRLPFAAASFDGVWASASLLHLTAQEAQRALREAARVLRTDGLLFVTLKQGDGAGWESARYGEPRFFQYWRGPDFDALAADVGFDVLASHVDEAARNTWLVRLLRVTPRAAASR